jgi:hypothetical protein
LLIKIRYDCKTQTDKIYILGSGVMPSNIPTKSELEKKQAETANDINKICLIKELYFPELITKLEEHGYSELKLLTYSVQILAGIRQRNDEKVRMDLPLKVRLRDLTNSNGIYREEEKKLDEWISLVKKLDEDNDSHNNIIQEEILKKAEEFNKI